MAISDAPEQIITMNTRMKSGEVMEFTDAQRLLILDCTERNAREVYHVEDRDERPEHGQHVPEIVAEEMHCKGRE